MASEPTGESVESRSENTARTGKIYAYKALAGLTVMSAAVYPQMHFALQALLNAG